MSMASRAGDGAARKLALALLREAPVISSPDPDRRGVFPFFGLYVSIDGLDRAEG